MWICWLQLHSCHEANIRRGGTITIRGNQQHLAESASLGDDRALLRPTGMTKTPGGTLGSHGDGLPAPTLHHSPAFAPSPSPAIRAGGSGRGLGTHSPPPCRRSCCAGQCAAPGTPSGQPLCPQVLGTRHSVTYKPALALGKGRAALPRAPSAPR